MAAEDTEISEEDLVEAIKKISASAQALAKSGLNRRAIVALVHDRSKVAKKTIEIVLNNLEDLAEHYTNG